MKRLALASILLAACVAPDDATLDRPALAGIRHVFVVALENHDATQVYGNPDAPYVNGTLLAAGAHATAFHDELPLATPSEPHYVWLEAGTNVFPDHTFTTDLPPAWFGNSTSSTAHLSSQLDAAGVSWMSYQEDLNWLTGACPINDWWWYAAKHDPFVFFQDVSGASPSASNARCAAHHRDAKRLAGDLASGDVASYVFVTPNLCHDMHGALFCPDGNGVRAGDAWLAAHLPAIVDYANANDGVVFVVWDEGDATGTMPFVALGPSVKPGYAGGAAYDHGSVLKTVEEIFGVPILPTVTGANDLSDLLQ